jgi:hypothetical protein
MSEKTDFKTFLEQWNALQGQKTPELHMRIADWLQAAWDKGERRLLLQVFRAGGKSTIAGLFAAWLLYCDPNLRILVLAADEMLAAKMVRQVRKIIEKMELCEKLRPTKRDQWGADRFTVERTLELRDPSMLARGIESNITGSRADVVICDDVEVPNTCNTPEKRRLLRERLAETAFIMTPGATQLYVGTPHTYYTIYADAPRLELDEDKPFLDGYQRLTIPVLEDGVSAWPERYTAEEIARIERASGPHKFASQMMLRPVNIAEGRLDPAQLVFYGAELERGVMPDGLFLQGRRLTACSCWWDPAFGRGGDSSVVATLFTDAEGGYWLHDVTYISVRGETEDEATAQCLQVAALARRFHVPVVTVETNGIGQFLPGILRRELGLEKVPTKVRTFNNTRPKDQRIIEAFDALLAARALNVHERVRRTPFITEMQDWRPGRTGRDDGLDAVAGALLAVPMKVPGARFDGRQNWHGPGQHSAQTDFGVFT